jgi:hypothetical protein
MQDIFISSTLCRTIPGFSNFFIQKITGASSTAGKANREWSRRLISIQLRMGGSVPVLTL